MTALPRHLLFLAGLRLHGQQGPCTLLGIGSLWQCRPGLNDLLLLPGRFLRSQKSFPVIIAGGIPQKPLVVACIIGGLDLGTDLLRPILDIMLQPGRRKVLEPRTHLGDMPSVLTGKVQLLPGILQSCRDGIIGTGIRIVNPIVSVSIVGGIDHGADIVHMLCQLPIDLSDSLGIDLAVDDGAIHISRDKETLFLKPGIDILHTLADNVRAGAAIHICLADHHLLHPCFCTETQIVELDLLKAQLLCPQTDLHQIVPGLLLVGIHPDMVVAVPKQGPVSILQAPFRPHVSQPFIPEGRDPGDGIDAVILQPLKQPFHIPDIDLHRSQLLYQGRIHLTHNTSIIIF